MSLSMAEMLRQDMQCEGLLSCLHGLKPLDEECFRTLAHSDEPLTVDEVAERVDRERSTAYRSIKRLLDTGLVRQAQVNYDQGGYYHVYQPADPDEVADDMQRLLNDWYAQIGQLIGEFRTRYGEEIDATPTPQQ